MPIEAVKIPQNVYVEDRIIGPVTLRQIFMLLAGGGVSYIIYSLFKKAGYVGMVTTVIAWTPLAVMAAFAFVKIYSIPLLRFLFLLFEADRKPEIRRWQTRKGITIDPAKFTPKKGTVKGKADNTPKAMDSIEQLSSVLDLNILKDTGEANQLITPTMQQEPPPQTPKTPVDTITAKPEEVAVVRDVQPPDPHA